MAWVKLIVYSVFSIDRGRAERNLFMHKQYGHIADYYLYKNIGAL